MLCPNPARPKPVVRALHLDVTGGIAGDMFMAAMLSAFPAFRGQLDADLVASGVSKHVRLDVFQVKETGFAATRVDVTTNSEAPTTSHWWDIRALVEASALRAPVKSRVIAIFTHLAEAEALCHGVSVDEVHFHEIADWDSLADIIGAASLIEQAKAQSWSVSALPMGRGRVKTRHGLVPVPAPATAELLRGFEMFSDAAEGERITPTGAAILRHLSPDQSAIGPQGRIDLIGTGAGCRALEGVANLLRVMVLEKEDTAQEVVDEIAFEIDDMTPEELSISLNVLRQTAGVLDAGFEMRFGKKGRAVFAVTLLGEPAQTSAIIKASFEETSTIGLRVQSIARHILPRELEMRENVQVKTVLRPGGITRKVESDALACTKTLKARRALARAAEQIDE